MVAKRGTKRTTGKKLKLKKETIRTLEVRDKATKVKGGIRPSYNSDCVGCGDRA